MSIEDPDLDVLEQQRDAGDTDDDPGWDEAAGPVLEADPSDLVEQHRGVPLEEDESGWDLDRAQSVISGVARAGDLGLLTPGEVDWLVTQALRMTRVPTEPAGPDR